MGQCMAGGHNEYWADCVVAARGGLWPILPSIQPGVWPPPCCLLLPISPLSLYLRTTPLLDSAHRPPTWCLTKASARSRSALATQWCVHSFIHTYAVMSVGITNTAVSTCAEACGCGGDLGHVLQEPRVVHELGGCMCFRLCSVLPISLPSCLAVKLPCTC